MKSVPVCLAVLLLTAVCARAKPLNFPSENVGIEIPETWDTTRAPTGASRPEARLFVMVKNPGNDRFVAIFLHEATVTTPLAIDSFLEGTQKPFRDQGWQTFPAHDETINELPFVMYSVGMQATQPPGMFMASVFTTKRAYTVQGISKVGDPAKDPEIQGILQSFHFLTPVESVQHHSAAYRLSYPFVRAGGVVALLVAVGAIIFLLKRGKR